MELSSIKNLELDKICRVCLAAKRDMRPLFGEMVADMLMECARVTIENTDGWPDKICVQCVHQVSRCHAFKTRVEKSDQELRNYIKGLTVIVEEPITQIDIQSPQSHHHQQTTTTTLATTNHHNHQQQHQQQQHQPKQQQQQQIHHNQRIATQTIQTINASDLIPHQTTTRQEIINHQHLHPIGGNRQTANAVTTAHHHHHHQVHQVQTATGAITNEVPQQVVISNGQIHNAQILNNGQIVTTTHHGGHQQIAQIVNAGQIGQLIQTGNTVQMIQQNGQAAQVVQIQRTADDRCEIIVQPDVTDDTQYYEDVTVTQAIQGVDQVETVTAENVIHIQEATCDDEIDDEEDELMSDDFAFELELSDGDSDAEDKLYLAEFISLQTSCPSPGRYVCNLCRKEFKHSKWLQSHMKSHSNWIKANCKRQPQCEICHRSFKGPGMLKMHMKTHEKTADKPPTCNICNKTFKSKTILYRHRQTHQAKSYQCGNCFKAFTSPYTLSSHMTKKHSTDEQKFGCFHCDDIVTSIEELKTHITTRHGNVKE